jgi:hypothetical protein
MVGRINDGVIHDHLDQPTGWKVQGECIDVNVTLYGEVERSASLYLSRHAVSGMWAAWESGFDNLAINVSFVKGFQDEQQAKAFLWDRLQYLTREVAVVRGMLLEDFDRINNMYAE